jgi:hypothetical protein
MKRNSNKHNDKDQSITNFDPSKFKSEASLTNKAIQEFLVNKLNDKISKKRDIDALVNTIQEFLTCFIVIGYNFDGEPVNFISAHSQQEADSLATLVNKLFVSQNSNRDNS